MNAETLTTYLDALRMAATRKTKEGRTYWYGFASRIRKANDYRANTERSYRCA